MVTYNFMDMELCEMVKTMCEMINVGSMILMVM